MGDQYDDMSGLGAMSRHAYRYVIDGSSGGVATSTSETRSRKTDHGGKFIVERIGFVAWITAALASAVAGTPLPRDSSPGSDSNEMPPLTRVLIELYTADVRWMSDPISAVLLTDEGHSPGLMLTQDVIPGGQEVFAKIHNNTAVTIAWQLVLVGRKQRGKRS